jgi:hypothetical protein
MALAADLIQVPRESINRPWCTFSTALICLQLTNLASLSNFTVGERDDDSSVALMLTTSDRPDMCTPGASN